MAEIAALEKSWRDRGRFRAVKPGMCLEKDGLVLGARTVLAERDRDGNILLDGREEKLLTLLSVAYGGPVSHSVLSKLRRAGRHARGGDEPIAAMEVALALPELQDPAPAARRLFIADGLLETGVSPRDIWTALEFDPAPLDALAKEYNQAEPRVPGGSGRVSGEWTSGDAVEAAEAAAEAAATNIVRELLLNGARGAARYAPLISFLAPLLDASSAGGTRTEGAIRGIADLRYVRYGDEAALRIVRASDNRTLLVMYLGTDESFVDPGSGLVAHLEHGELVFDALSARDEAKPDDDFEEPKLCPKPPLPDSQGLVGPSGARSKAYEDYMKAKINPLNPTPHGFGYQLANPFDGGAIVKYDDCQNEPAILNLPGSMLEFKGPGYAAKLTDKYFGEKFTENIEDQWTDQATRQVQASGGRPVVWYFAERPALDFAQKLFNNEKLKGIRLEYAPWPGGETWK